MPLRILPLVRPLVTIALLGGVAAAAYFTRDSWWPYVFPPKAAEQEDAPAEEPHDHGEALHGTLSPLAQKHLGIEAAEPVPREYWRKMVIPGVVVDLPGESDRRVATKVAGVVTEVNVGLGDDVKPGGALFKIHLVSDLLQITQAELGRVASDLKFETAERDRLQKGVAAGTVSTVELKKQQNLVDRLELQLKAARRQLLALGLTDPEADLAQKGEPVADVVVSAPLAPPPSALPGSGGWQFEVRSLRVAIGDPVQAGQVLCELANHRRLLVEGAAFKSEAKALAKVAADRVPVEVHEIPTLKGRMQYMAERAKKLIG